MDRQQKGQVTTQPGNNEKGHATSGLKDNRRGKILIGDRRKQRLATTRTGTEGTGQNHKQTAMGQVHNRGQATSGWKDNRRGKLLIWDRRKQRLATTRTGTEGTGQNHKQTAMGQVYNRGQATTVGRQ